MTRPTAVPSVEMPEDSGPTDPSVVMQTTEPPTEQIWVRSATYGAGAYTLTLATAPGGTFEVSDTRAVGGGLLPITQDTPPDLTCKTVSDKPLGSPIKGALKNVTRLVTLTCPAASAMRRPAIQGVWGDDTNSGATTAVFVVGGEKVQGRPLLPSEPPVSHDDPVDAQITSVRHSGNTLTATVWATDYVGLSLSPADNPESGDLPECTTSVSSAHRPGVKNKAEQRLFTVTCTPVKSTKRWNLDVSRAIGRTGGEVVYAGDSVPLPVVAASATKAASGKPPSSELAVPSSSTSPR